MNGLPALLLAVATGTGLATVHIGAPPPDFLVAGAQGGTPLSHLRGKPVVLNLWASWCPPCTAELPYFQRVQQQYGDRVDVVTVSDEPPGVAAAYLRAHALPLSLTDDASGKIFAAYSAPPIPDTVVLDAEGDVIYVSVGGLSWPELEHAVEKALALSAPVQAASAAKKGWHSHP